MLNIWKFLSVINLFRQKNRQYKLPIFYLILQELSFLMGCFGRCLSSCRLCFYWFFYRKAWGINYLCRYSCRKSDYSNSQSILKSVHDISSMEKEVSKETGRLKKDKFRMNNIKKWTVLAELKFEKRWMVSSFIIKKQWIRINTLVGFWVFALSLSYLN